MKTTWLKITIALALVVSLFAPTIISVVGSDDNRVALVNPIEEEPGKEQNKEVKELDVFFEETFQALPAGVGDKHLHSFYYLSKSSDYLQKIILPPPEQLV